jgi:tetratricopeptide (TPR) repeat protein
MQKWIQRLFKKQRSRQHWQLRIPLFLGIFCSLMVTSASAQGDQNSCGSLANTYGPFDYRTQREKLKIVEEFHFTPLIEALIRRPGSSQLGSDIAYTLVTFPNHHRALISLGRLAEKSKSNQLPGMDRPVECYFERATRFAPNDTVVRILYARFLAANNRSNASSQQLDVAVLQAKDNPMSHYNIGLAFFEIGQYDKALIQAHKSESLGFDGAVLRERLKKAGQWQEFGG